MAYVLLTISGHDRAGIVRDVADTLFHAQANIEDSSMTALRGRFTMMLVVSMADDGDFSALKAALADLEQRTALSVRSEAIADEEFAILPAEPDCVVTVTGADKPGIVFAVTELLAAEHLSVVDLSTRSRASAHGNSYMMALEAAGLGDRADALRAALQTLSVSLQVEIELHELDGAIF